MNAGATAAAFARRRAPRLRAQIALAQADRAALSAGERRDGIDRDVAILRRELDALAEQDLAHGPSDPASEAIAIRHEHEETLHLADNVEVYLQRGDAIRTRRWLDRLRRDLATSSLPVSIEGLELDAPLDRLGAHLDRVRAQLSAAITATRT